MQLKQTMNIRWEKTILARWWQSLLHRKQSYQHRYDAEQERNRLIQDIRQAHLAWQEAKQQLNLVDGHDQVDCAIYLYEAAQKKYEMLLRQAKSTKLHAVDYYLPMRKRAI